MLLLFVVYIYKGFFFFFYTNQLVCVATREEKSEQMLDCRHELENMEAELKRIQQEVRRRAEGRIAAASSEHGCNSDLVTALQIIQINA